MASSGDTVPSENNEAPLGHALISKPPATVHDEVSQKKQPDTSWESDGTPSVDDSIYTDGDGDSDSAVSGLTEMSTTASLSPSIYEHIEENGRTYHRYKAGKYFFPNDEQEQDRLEIQHALFGVTLHGKLYLAPLKGDPPHVLDIGTGTGVWAIDFAIQHSSSNVLGTDLSAIQPKFVPPNCRFEVDDAEDDWVFSTKFDFIHGRTLVSCFNEPASVLRKAFDSLQPGGYLEMQDGIFPMRYAGEPPVHSDLYKWNELVLEAVNKSGRPWDATENYMRWMREIGFEDVVEKTFYWPTSTWAKGEYFKQVSLYWQADLLNGLEGVSMKVLTKFLGWTAEEVRAFLVGVRKDVKDRSIHAYLTIKVVYGRKPLTTG